MHFNMLNNDKVILNNKNGVKYFTFPILSATELVTHAFSTREGGVSKGIYSSMNLSLKLDDCKEDVLENIKIFSKAVGFEHERIVMSNQTHSNVVRCINEEDIGTGILKPGFSDDVDGMITNIPGIVLMTFYADCVPIYFLDIEKKVIALSHSGWRGTFDEIAKVTIEKMNEAYNCNPSDIKVVTGPCICMDCYEVSLELGEKFTEKFGNDEKCVRFTEGKCFIDLSQIIRLTLISSGIKEENIVLSKICTCCNRDLLHSHRATGGKRGLLAAMMSLREDYE